MIWVLKLLNLLKLKQNTTLPTHSLSQKSNQRDENMLFFWGNPMAKATTIQSFKGYEAKAIVLYINKMQDEELAYVGLTRLKENSEGNFITVINANQD